MIYLEAIEAELVEQRIYSAQGAEVTAEKPVDKYGTCQEEDQEPDFPVKESARQFPQVFILQEKENTAFKSACGANVFAKEGISHTKGIGGKNGEKHHKDQKDKIFKVSKRLVCFFRYLYLFSGYLMQKVLNQTKGTQETADQPSQNRSEKHQGSENVKGKIVLRTAQYRLQRANGAGTQRSGAGIAVQHRNTDQLGISGKDPALGKPYDIAVKKRGGSYPEDKAESFVVFFFFGRLQPIPMHSRHIFTAFLKTSPCSPL